MADSAKADGRKGTAEGDQSGHVDEGWVRASD